jgi:hypothetical protein
VAVEEGLDALLQDEDEFYFRWGASESRLEGVWSLVSQQIKHLS